MLFETKGIRPEPRNEDGVPVKWIDVARLEVVTSVHAVIPRQPDAAEAG